ncbi:hypothetical protein NQT69_11485 [Pseudoalteromonas shioyasakiensis]|uniref:hypothetical protein n=1 Tax=Pseudoalteromonas shioyasakiensis TaxID=1190813 RepID=UPI0021199802|nr:hypothetical protein [Pseudoalteromonas shioyasakiensis]MCQ8878626.1 hypothetical protein [Pseudoalteromonas shioyasakiensis]
MRRLYSYLISLKLFWLILVLLLSTGCSTLTEQQRLDSQQKIANKQQQLLDAFISQQPAIEQDLNNAAGYIICETNRMMILALGGQNGLCLLIDKQKNEQTVLDLNSVNLGVGLGASQTQYLITFQNADLIKQIKDGHFSVKLNNLSKTKQTAPSTTLEYEHKTNLYSLNKEGSIAALSVSAITITKNQSLNDAKFAVSKLPTKIAESQTVTEWPYALPFLADKVIAKGFALPKPYGIGFTYVDVQQQMSLTQLLVGFNGNGTTPYEFVSFDTPITSLNTTQLKADMWLLPFLNVFATVGKVQGDLHADVLLDGNTMLNQLGEDCQSLIKPISCRLLQDSLFTLPIRATIDPTTYGLGFILAGAWQDWFFALPTNITWSQSNRNVLDGQSLTITPRAGRIIHLPKLGRLALFIGGNYLDSHNVVTGSLTSEGGFSLDYQVKQSNVNRWNMVTGFNWDISSSLSLNIEYNGFINDRDAIIAGLTVRY